MHKPVLPAVEVAGSVEEFGYGWLHIMLHTLLPHCRYQTPSWMSDTIRRLLDGYEACGKGLPFYSHALLVIDEHTGIEGRHIFDQDNKGWKAVSNAIKGRLIPDDDQHTLAVTLLSTRTEGEERCHITLLPIEDATTFSPRIPAIMPPATSTQDNGAERETGEKVAKPRQVTSSFWLLGELFSPRLTCRRVYGFESLDVTDFLGRVRCREFPYSSAYYAGAAG